MLLTVMCKGFVTTRGLITTLLNPFSLFCLFGFCYTHFFFSKMGNTLLLDMYLVKKNIK